MDKQDIIYDLVKGMKDDQDEMKDDIMDIKSNVRIHAISLDRYNNLLDIHIAGVDTLKKLHLDNAKRIELLEEPYKINKMIYKKTLKVLAFLTAIGGLIAVIQKMM